MIVRWTRFLFCILIMGGCGQLSRPPELSAQELADYKDQLHPIVDALQQWHTVNGALPEDLSALVPQYLSIETLAVKPPIHDLVYVGGVLDDRTPAYVGYFLELTIGDAYKCSYVVELHPDPSEDWSCLYLPGMAP